MTTINEIYLTLYRCLLRLHKKMKALSVSHIFGTIRCYPIETLHVHSLCQDKPYLPLVEQFFLNQIVIKHFLGAVENHKSVASATQPQWLYNLSREEYFSSNVTLKPFLSPDRMLLYCSLPCSILSI